MRGACHAAMRLCTHPGLSLKVQICTVAPVPIYAIIPSICTLSVFSSTQAHAYLA